MPDVPLDPGISRQEEFVVDGDLLTDVGGTLLVPVLSTPSMIGVMEKNATKLAREHLPEGMGTVGFEVCIKHVGGAVEGTTCTVSAELREVVDGRKLRFEVEVRSGERVIGVGTHERRIIDLAAHAQELSS
jgi:fluoroacetyl-CoA thioesterase